MVKLRTSVLQVPHSQESLCQASRLSRPKEFGSSIRLQSNQRPLFPTASAMNGLLFLDSTSLESAVKTSLGRLMLIRTDFIVSSEWVFIRTIICDTFCVNSIIRFLGLYRFSLLYLLRKQRASMVSIDSINSGRDIL